MVVYLELAAFRPHRLARAEMLGFGYRRLKGSHRADGAARTEVTSHFGEPELPEKVIPSTTGLAQNSGPGEAQ